MPEYNRLKIKDLRQIGKDMGLLRIDKNKKKDLIARIEKGRQLSDYSKKLLLEQAQNIDLSWQILKCPRRQSSKNSRVLPFGIWEKKD